MATSWSFGSKSSAPSWSQQSKSTAPTWSSRPKSGNPWLYNDGSILYNDPNGVYYNSIGISSSWGFQSKN